jgi:hypothetical protein
MRQLHDAYHLVIRISRDLEAELPAHGEHRCSGLEVRQSENEV